MQYTGPALPTNGDHIHAIGDMFVGALPGKNSGKMPLHIQPPPGWRSDGQVTWWVKGDKVYAGLNLTGSGGGKLQVCTSIPLKNAQRLLQKARAMASAQGVELGWSLWKSMKKGASKLGKTVKKAGSKLTAIVKNPTFQKIALTAAATVANVYIPGSGAAIMALQNSSVEKIVESAAPIAQNAFGVPPNITAMAAGVVQGAMQKNTTALDKVANIANLASQGIPQAQQLQDTMKMLYRGGMRQLGMQGVAPFGSSSYGMPWGQPQYQAPYSPYGMQMPQMRMPQMMPQMRMPQMQMPQMQMPPWMQQMQRMPSPYGYGAGGYGMPQAPGMFPFRVQQPSGARLSGWLYNIPYRGNIAALSLDKGHPGHIVRSMYQKGMAV